MKRIHIVVKAESFTTGHGERDTFMTIDKNSRAFETEKEADEYIKAMKYPEGYYAVAQILES